MGTPVGIRYPFLGIVLFGVLASALSLTALVRAISSTTEAQRLERAEESVAAEVDRLARLPPSPASLSSPQSTAYVGMHGGWLASTASVSTVEGLALSWRAPLGQTIAACFAGAARHVDHAKVDGALLLTAAAPAPDRGRCAFVAYRLSPSSYLSRWRWIAAALAAGTGLLALTTLWGAFAFRRNVRDLHRTLLALGNDLHAEIPRTRIAELNGVADGIRGMAAALLASREATERLGRELAAQERLAALGRVTAGVAHEVRNPLAAIKLRLDLTAAAHALPEATRADIDAASAEIARLDRLVADLLLVAGRRPAAPREVAIGALAGARAEAVAPWARSRGITIRVSGEARALADVESVGRAIDNLLRNAVEASPASATVEVRVADAGEAVEVRVEDRGVGVEPERAGELFEPFFTTKPDGTGLGLAISRAIARAHGGDVVYERHGEITRFVLSLAARGRIAA